jgi:hypothetical protein
MRTIFVLFVALWIAPPAAASPPAGEPGVALSPLEGIVSQSREERVRAFRVLSRRPDADALPALMELARRRFEDPEEREESWSLIARLVERLAPFHEIPEELVGFLHSIAHRRPEVQSLRHDLDYPVLGPRYAFAYRARDALRAIALRTAELALRAELDAIPSEGHARHLAEAAWLTREQDGPRVAAARRLLHRASAEGVEASASLVARAPSASHRALADFLGSYRYRFAPEAAAAALLALAASPDPDGAASALSALALWQPPGVARPLVRMLEDQSFAEERVRAALPVLGALGDPAAVAFAARQLEVRRDSTRAYAARALADLGAPGRRVLIEVVEGDRPGSWSAAVALAESRDPGAREAIWRLAERTPETRQRARLLALTVATPDYPTPRGVSRAARRDRMDAIARLAFEPGEWGAESLDALAALLLAESPDLAEREESWLLAARGARAQALSVRVPDTLEARLRVLAGGQPRVRTLELGLRHPPRLAVRFPYPAAAAEAVRAIACAREGCPLADLVASFRETERTAFLSALAWGEGPYAARARRSEARALLAAAGSTGLADSRAAFARAPEEAQVAMLEYWRRVYEDTDDPGAVEALLDATLSPHWSAWHGALRQLREMDVLDLAPGLIRRARQGPLPDEDYARAVFETLGKLEDPRAISFLAEQLAHPDPWSGREAGNALRRLGERGRDVLIEASRSSDGRRRRAAVAALAAASDDRRARRAVRLALRAHPEDARSEILGGLRP